MKWFSGSFKLAQQISKRNGALLVVFVDDKDEEKAENSRQMNAIWDEIDESLFSCPVMAMRIEKDDASHGDFSQLYATPLLPATYFIDQSGKPIEIVTMPMDMENFIEIVNDVIQMKEWSILDVPSTSSSFPFQDSIELEEQIGSEQQHNGAGQLRPSEVISGEQGKESPRPITSDRCRIRVCFPDGSAMDKEFAPSDPLSKLIDTIKEDGRVRCAFTLSTYSLEVIFSAEDESKSFLDLCLFPSSQLKLTPIVAPPSLLSLPFHLFFTSRPWKALLVRLKMEENIDPNNPDEEPEGNLTKKLHHNEEDLSIFSSHFLLFLVFLCIFPVYFHWRRRQMIKDALLDGASALADLAVSAYQDMVKEEPAVNRSSAPSAVSANQDSPDEEPAVNRIPVPSALSANQDNPNEDLGLFEDPVVRRRGTRSHMHNSDVDDSKNVENPN